MTNAIDGWPKKLSAGAYTKRFRVAWGVATVLNPENEVVDPNAANRSVTIRQYCPYLKGRQK